MTDAIVSAWSGLRCVDDLARVELRDRDRDARRTSRGRGAPTWSSACCERLRRGGACACGACEASRGAARGARATQRDEDGESGFDSGRPWTHPQIIIELLCDSTKHRTASSRSPFASWRRTRASAASASTAATAGGGSASARRCTRVSSPRGATPIPRYRAEVHLEARIPVEDWTAVLTGRLDGCVERAPGPVADRGAQVDQPLGRRASAPPATPSSGTGGSCSATATSGGGSATRSVTGALVYVDIETGEEVSLDVPFDDEIEREVERRLARAARDLAGRRRSRARARPRRPSGSPSRTPRPRPDPGEADRGGPQRRRARARTSSPRRRPARARPPPRSIPRSPQGLTTGRQVVFLTSKTLQQKMAVSALVAMNERAFHDASRSARRKRCARTTGSSATRSSAASRKDYPEKMERSNILGRLRDSYSHLDPDTVFEEARREEVCPFEVQLELAAARRRDRRRLQLRLRARRRAAAPDGRGPRRTRSCSSTRRTTCRTARARSSRRRSSRRTSRALRNRLALQPGDLFADLARLGRGPARDPRAARRGAARGRGDRRDRAARRARSSTCALDWEAEAHALPRVEARDAARARRTTRSWTSTSRCSASPPSSNLLGPGLHLRRRAPRRRASGSRSSASIRRGRSRRSSEQASSTILLSATLTPPEAIQRVLGPRAGPHVVDLAAAAVPAREPQGHDRAVTCGRRTRRARRTTPRIAKLLARDVRRALAATTSSSFPSYRFLTEVADAHADDALAPARPAAGPLRLRAAAAARGARRRRRRTASCSSRSRAACTPRAWTIPGELLSARLRRLARAAPGLLRAGAAAPLLRREGGGRLRLRVPAAGHDARRPGGGPAHPQRDRPRRDRAHLPRASSRSRTPAACRATGTTRRPRELATKRPADEIREFFGGTQ